MAKRTGAIGVALRFPLNVRRFWFGLLTDSTANSQVCKASPSRTARPPAQKGLRLRVHNFSCYIPLLPLGDFPTCEHVQDSSDPGVRVSSCGFCMMTRDEIISACYQIPGQTWPTELGWLYDELQNSKSHVEIGTYCGRSLLASCGGMSDATVISVDNFSASSSKEWVESVLNATLRMIPRSVSVRVLQMHSIDAARQCCIQGLQFDSLFIDGCHEYAECKADIEAWRPMIKPGEGSKRCQEPFSKKSKRF